MEAYEKILNGYSGSAILPADFDAFWQRKVAEMEEMELDYSISQAEIPVCPCTKFLDIRMKGFAGADLYAKYVLPVSDRPVPVVLQFHGYPGASRGWFEQSSFAGMGFAVIAMDCPGLAGYSNYNSVPEGTLYSDHIIMGLGGRPDELYYTQTYLDTCLMVRLAEALPELDSSRIFVSGGSQGGGLSIVCAALNPGKIRKAAILYPFLADMKCAYDCGSDAVVFTGMKYWKRWHNQTADGDEEMFTKLGYIDALNFADKISCPVLFGTGLKDVFIPPKAQLATYARIRSPKELVIYPDYGHEEIADFDDRIIGFFTEGRA